MLFVRSLLLLFIDLLVFYVFLFFFFKQKTAYEMRISDWSSDVCSSDLTLGPLTVEGALAQWCRSETSIEIRLYARDQGRLDGAPEHAPAIAREHRGVAIDGGTHACARSAASA